LVSGPLPSIEWIHASGPGPSGAAGVERAGHCGRWDGRGLRALLPAHAAPDVEEPDIAPGSRGASWLPRFGNPVQTAIGQFTVRTLARSRQHRMILAFYLGIGFALTLFLLKAPAMKPQLPDAPATDPWRAANTPLLAVSIMMMALALVGTRVVFALPLDLRANWIFRITGVR